MPDYYGNCTVGSVGKQKEFWEKRNTVIHSYIHKVVERKCNVSVLVCGQWGSNSNAFEY